MKLPTPFRPPYQPGSDPGVPTPFRPPSDPLFFRPPYNPPEVGRGVWGFAWAHPTHPSPNAHVDVAVACFRRFVTGEGTRRALRWCAEPWREATNVTASQNHGLTDVLSVSFLGISHI